MVHFWYFINLMASTDNAKYDDDDDDDDDEDDDKKHLPRATGVMARFARQKIMTLIILTMRSMMMMMMKMMTKITFQEQPE